jgi:hypothetical protein
MEKEEELKVSYLAPVIRYLQQVCVFTSVAELWFGLCVSTGRDHHHRDVSLKSQAETIIIAAEA